MVEIYFGLTEKHIENFETIILHKGKNDKNYSKNTDY